MFFALPKDKGWFNATRLWARNVAFLTGLFPFLGWLFSGILYWKQVPYDPKATMEKEMEFGVGSKAGLFQIQGGANVRERVLKALDFMPISEIMAGEDGELKRGAIDRLADIKTPESIQLLHQYRTDPNMDIRFFVTTALSRVKKEFEEGLHAAKAEMQKDVYKIEFRIVLARTYLRYARSQLLDETTVKAYEEEALYHLQFSILDEEAPPEVFWILIDIYRAIGNYKRALQVLDVLEKRKKGSFEEVLRTRARILYRLDRYDELAALLKASQKRKGMSPQMSALANWWAG